MANPTGFLEAERQNTPYVDSKTRLKSWSEFQKPLKDKVVEEQAGRCMDCGTPFCHTGMLLGRGASGCPVYNYIPDWNDAVYRGQWKEALDLLLQTNNFPEFTGRVCPAPCEGSCVLGINKAPVTIKAIENSIIEKGFAENWIKPKPPKTLTGKRVAIVGSGPAGLACADQLNQVGHEVIVFERDDRLGGLLMYGIPNMKLDKRKVVERRLTYLKANGIKFKTGVEIGKVYPVEKLRSDFDAVVLCCGSTVPRDLLIPGREAKGIYFAMDYLKANTKSLLDSQHRDQAYINAKSKRVIVIGGGDTGTDCVGTALRQGCHSILQLEILQQPKDASQGVYLKSPTEISALSRSKDNPWPQYPHYYYLDYGQQEALALQGQDPRQYTSKTRAFIQTTGKIKGLKVDRVCWKKTQLGQCNLEIIPNTTHILEADLILLALGYMGVENTLPLSLGLNMTDRQTIAAPYGDFKTNLEGVFAAGDARRGQSLVVWAIHEGRGAAQACDRYLMGSSHLPFTILQI